ncbi:hypothetical protein SRHO_G00047930 [Serrasalmus rhombeus]
MSARSSRSVPVLEAHHVAVRLKCGGQAEAVFLGARYSSCVCSHWAAFLEPALAKISPRAGQAALETDFMGLMWAAWPLQPQSAQKRDGQQVDTPHPHPHALPCYCWNRSTRLTSAKDLHLQELLE